MTGKRIRRTMTPEQADAMIEAYLNGMPTRETAALFGFTKKAVLDLLKRKGIVYRGQSEARKLYYATHPDLTDFHRIYAVDDTFFDVIDTEEKAYWLGFFTADGNVNLENSAIRLTLNNEDEGHVLKFKAALKSEQPLYYTAKTRAVGLEIGSRRLTRTLIGHGIVPNKSLVVKRCSGVPPELHRDYFRGLVDGDGSLMIYGVPPLHHGVISLSGTWDIVEAFREYVAQSVETKARVLRGHGNYQISFANRMARQVCALLYRDSTIYLDRKYEAARLIGGW